MGTRALRARSSSAPQNVDFEGAHFLVSLRAPGARLEFPFGKRQGVKVPLRDPRHRDQAEAQDRDGPA